MRAHLSAHSTDTDWFKAEDLRQRGSVDAVLHWHHTAIRVPCFAVVFHRWLAPRMGQPADPAAGDKGEADLRLSLKVRCDIVVQTKASSY